MTGQHGWGIPMIPWKNIGTINDQRLIELLDWVQGAMNETLVAIEPLNGDASFRRYFRLKLASKTVILMDSPIEQENPRPFVEIARWWHTLGVPVPRIFAFNLEIGALLIEDCGNQDVFSSLSMDARQSKSWTTAPTMSSDDRGLYRQALALLKHIQSLTKDTHDGEMGTTETCNNTIGIYDAPKLRQELALFEQWFVPEFMPETRTRLSHNALNTIYDLLIENALNQPKVLVHRDFHARNLMVTTEGLKVLDFQDAVWGPVTYDWVSLLRDCYLCWSPIAERRLLSELYHQESLLQATFKDFNAFYQAYEWMGLQRHLKVLGIFTRLWRRDKKTAYLASLPRVLNYAVSVLDRYLEFEPLASCLKGQWLSKRVQTIVTP